MNLLNRNTSQFIILTSLMVDVYVVLANVNE